MRCGEEQRGWVARASEDCNVTEAQDLTIPLATMTFLVCEANGYMNLLVGQELATDESLNTKAQREALQLEMSPS